MNEMGADQVEWSLLKLLAIEEVGVDCKKRDAWSNLKRPCAPSLGKAELGPERPAIVAEIEQLGAVIR